MNKTPTGLLETAPPKPSERIAELLPQLTEELASHLRKDTGLTMSEEQWAEMRKNDELISKLADAAAKAAIVIALDELHARIRKLEGPTHAEAMAVLEQIHGGKQ